MTNTHKKMRKKNIWLETKLTKSNRKFIDFQKNDYNSICLTTENDPQISIQNNYSFTSDNIPYKLILKNLLNFLKDKISNSLFTEIQNFLKMEMNKYISRSNDKNNNSRNHSKFEANPNAISLYLDEKESNSHKKNHGKTLLHMNTNSAFTKIKNLRYNNRIEKNKISSDFILKKINTQKKISLKKNNNNTLFEHTNNYNIRKMQPFEMSYDFGVRNKKSKNVIKKPKMNNLSYSFLTKKNTKQKIGDKRKKNCLSTSKKSILYKWSFLNNKNHISNYRHYYNNNQRQLAKKLEKNNSNNNTGIFIKINNHLTKNQQRKKIADLVKKNSDYSLLLNNDLKKMMEVRKKMAQTKENFNKINVQMNPRISNIKLNVPFNKANIINNQNKKSLAINEDILKKIKNTLDDDNLKGMLNFSYENFLSKESERDSKDFNYEETNNIAIM